MKHHEFSPSRLMRIANCPWSYKNCMGWDGGNSADASRGSMLHEAIRNEDVRRTLSEKDAELIRQVKAEHVDRFLKYEHYFELPVSMCREDGTELTFGTLDFLYLSGDRTIAGLTDWKFGAMEVEEAKNNLQIKAYAAGIFQKFPSVQKIFAMVVQPIYGMDDYEKQFEFTRDMLPGIVQEIEAVELVAEIATENDAVPSPANCQYCNKLHCAKYRERMELNFSLMETSGDLPLAEKEMTLEFADHLLCAKREIESLMDDRAEIAKKILIDAGGSEHFRVQSGRVTQKTDWQALVKHCGISEELVQSFTEHVTGSPYLMPRMRKSKKSAPALEK